MPMTLAEPLHRLAWHIEGGLVRRLASLVLLAATGCSGTQIEPAERVDLVPGEGILVVAIDSSSTIEVVDVCRMDDEDVCERAGPFLPPGGVKLLRLPAGTWCVNKVTFEMAFDAFAVMYELGVDTCMHVPAGAVAYAGHVNLTLRPKDFRLVELLVHRPQVATAFIDREHPQLKSLPWVERR